MLDKALYREGAMCVKAQWAYRFVLQSLGPGTSAKDSLVDRRRVGVWRNEFSRFMAFFCLNRRLKVGENRAVNAAILTRSLTSLSKVVIKDRSERTSSDANERINMAAP